jgi:hypothetical protein
MMVREFGFPSTGPASFCGLAAVGFAAIATFLGFTAGSGLNGARFGSIGVVELSSSGASATSWIFGIWIRSSIRLAAVLVKQPCEVHVCTTPRGGKGQLQPIKVAHRAPMRNGLINSFPRGQNPVPAFP